MASQAELMRVKSAFEPYRTFNPKPFAYLKRDLISYNEKFHETILIIYKCPLLCQTHFKSSSSATSRMLLFNRKIIQLEFSLT